MNGIIEDEITVGTPIGEIIPPEDKAAELFIPNGLDKIIALIRKEVEQFQPDISTEKGRKAIASLARKVSSSMARLEEYGKNLSMNIKRQATGIDGERKRMKGILTALRDQARKPLDDYEEAVKARVDAHEQALLAVSELSNVPFGASVVEIEERIAKLDEFALRPWEEFADRFSLANDAVSLRLGNILALTKKQEEDQAAFAKLEAERIARESKEAQERQAKEQAERDERIAAEATQRAEAASQREKEAAEARAAKAEQEAKEAAERATAAEQKRAADAKAAEDAAALARENDKAHKAKINNAAVESLVAFMPKDVAKEVVTAIAQGKIPNVKIAY
jgi:aminopeptidase N